MRRRGPLRARVLPERLDGSAAICLAPTAVTELNGSGGRRQKRNTKQERLN